MANYYFEIPEGATFFGVTGPYVTVHNHQDDKLILRGYLRVVQHSYRVWKETADGIFFIKNRVTGSPLPVPLTDEDLKEFVWIKLQSKIILSK